MLDNIFIEPSDYEIERHGSREFVFINGANGQRLAAIFATRMGADAFIWERTHPAILSAPVFSDICRCAALMPGWDYVKTDDLIYELCRRCKNPLRANVLKECNARYLGDFDLDDFINGD